MMRPTRFLLAAALAAATLASGCELMAAPPPVAQRDNIGVDPSGTTVDTSTEPPETAEEQRLTESPSSASGAPHVRVMPEEPPQSSAPPATRPPASRPPGTSGQRDRVTASGSIPRHHHLQSAGRDSEASSDSGDDRGGHASSSDNSGSGDEGDNGGNGD